MIFHEKMMGSIRESVWLSVVVEAILSVCICLWFALIMKVREMYTWT